MSRFICFLKVAVIMVPMLLAFGGLAPAQVALAEDAQPLAPLGAFRSLLGSVDVIGQAGRHTPRPALAERVRLAPATPATTTPATYIDAVRGTEFSAGTIVGDTRFGASFAGRATGDLPGVLVASVDYAPPSPGPGVANNIVGGGWTLRGSRGTVFGSFDGGTVRWNADGTLADVAANMSVRSGSVNDASVSGGTGTLVGVLDHTPLGQGRPPTIGGTLQLTF